MDTITNLPESTVHEGKAEFINKMPLDSLYTPVLQPTLSDDDSELHLKFWSTVGAVVLPINPLPPSGIAN